MVGVTEAEAIPVVVRAAENPGFDVGQILVAAVALAVGMLTVYAANKRHRQQLAHDRALRAADLAHDRQMRRREHTRDTVDSSLESVTEATRALARLAGALLAVEASRTEAEAVLQDEHADDAAKGRAQRTLDTIPDELRDLLDEAHYSTMKLIANEVRLTVRVGSEHPLVHAAKQTADTYRALYESLQVGYERNRTEEEREFEDRYVTEHVDPQARRFIDACEQWFQAA